MRNRGFNLSAPNRRASIAVLAAVAVVFVLSGCVPLWSLSGPGAALFTALLIAWSVLTLGRQDSALGQPLVRQDQRAVVTEARVAGDGMDSAELSLWLDRTILAEARRQGAYKVFGGAERAANPAAAGTEMFRTAELRGDGFSAQPDFVRAAKKDKMNPVEGNADAIDRGGVLFNTRCGTYCHGGQAIGGGCPSLVDEFWLHGDSDLDIYKVIAGGGGPGTRMGAFGGEFSADQIFDMMAYIRQRGKEFLLEKAGPRSYRQKGIECPSEIFLTLSMAGGATFQGLLRIEDKESVTLDDRSQELPTQYRVLKERILDGKLKCVE